ncbi:MAG: hypothetical protein KDA44_16395 [Planctomycetales bacterium]|nr:hypothetical protein [Planctomycetales bacterium]
MSTADFVAGGGGANFANARIALMRSLWKELRALRPLLVAMFVMTAVVAGFIGWVASSQYAISHTGRLWGIAAMCATALYAVGAAAALLAGEREEQTDRFYHIVAAPPGVVFAAKLIAIALSAVALILALCIAAALVEGFAAFGEFGFMASDGGGLLVLTALAWGVFAALICPHPLLAALLGIALASIVDQTSLSLVRNYGGRLLVPNWDDSLWLRMPVILAVLGVDVWLGRRWAEPGHAPSPLRRRPAGLNPRRHTHPSGEVDSDSSAAITDHGAVARELGTSPAEGPRRSAMLARLAWQTWREGRWALLAAVAIGLALVPAVELPLWLFRDQGANWLPPLPVSLLFVPALLGALAFRADHRRSAYEFLDQKAARPRLTWFARQALWFSVAGLLGLVAYLTVAALALWAAGDTIRTELLNHSPGYGPAGGVTGALRLSTVFGQTGAITWIAWSAWLAAYAWGQLCSMVVRRDVLAGFLAVLGAIVLCALAWVLWAWDLSGLAFLLPAAVAAAGASWWLAPPFLAARARRVDWLAAGAVIAGVVAALGWYLPRARLAQVADAPPYQNLTEMPSEVLASWKTTEVDARAVALRYEQAWNDIVPEQQAIRSAGIPERTAEELAAEAAILRYATEHSQQDPAQDEGSFGWAGEMGGYVAEFSADNFPDLDLSEDNPEVAPWRRTLNEAKSSRHETYLQANQSVIERIMAISQAPRCRFAANARLWMLADLLMEDAIRLIDDGQLDAAWQRIAALARLRAHSLQYQPSNNRQSQRHTSSRGFNALASGLLAHWASASGQTPERLRSAALDLFAAEWLYLPLSHAVVADYAELRAVALGEEPPYWLRRRLATDASRRTLPQAISPPHWSEQLPLAANQFWWERDRALRAADLLDADRLDFALGVEGQTIPIDAVRSIARAYNIWEPLTLLTFGTQRSVGWLVIVARQQAISSASTSWLIGQEWLQTQCDFGRLLHDELDAQAYRREQMLLLLLVAHRLEHGEYPDSLDEALAPMAERPIDAPWAQGMILPIPLTAWHVSDPFTRESLQYEPRGLDGPLIVNSATAGGEMIPAGTPLVWSRGASLAELTRVGPHVSAGSRYQSEAVASPTHYEFKYAEVLSQFEQMSSPVIMRLPVDLPQLPTQTRQPAESDKAQNQPAADPE